MKNILWIFVTAFLLFSCAEKKTETAVTNSETDTLISAEEILKNLVLGKNQVIKNKTVTGVLDFTKALKEDQKLNMSIAYLDGELNFINCKFLDDVSAFCKNKENNSVFVCVFNKTVNFLECKFLKGVNFFQSRFNDRFNFELCNVKGSAEFTATEFMTGVSFHSSEFQGGCSFISGTFFGAANFFKTLYKKELIIQNVKFFRNLTFCDSHFYGYFELSLSDVASLADFSNAKFSDRVVFSNSGFWKGAKFSGCEFSKEFAFEKNRSFSDLNFSFVYFKNSVKVNDNVVLGGIIQEKLAGEKGFNWEISYNKTISLSDTKFFNINK